MLLFTFLECPDGIWHHNGHRANTLEKEYQHLWIRALGVINYPFNRYLFLASHIDVTWVQWRLKLSAIRMFLFQQIMMTSSNGNIFRVAGHLCGEFTGPGEFPTERPMTRSFDVFFDLRLNKRLSKQPWGWWFETPSWSLWRQCNVVETSNNQNTDQILYYWLFMKRNRLWFPQ